MKTNTSIEPFAKLPITRPERGLQDSEKSSARMAIAMRKEVVSEDCSRQLVHITDSFAKDSIMQDIVFHSEGFIPASVRSAVALWRHPRAYLSQDSTHGDISLIMFCNVEDKDALAEFSELLDEVRFCLNEEGEKDLIYITAKQR